VKTKALLFGAYLGISLAASGCRESAELNRWIRDTSHLRESAESHAGDSLYRRPQHEAFKVYFSEVVRKTTLLKSDSKQARGFNVWAKKADLQAFCSSVFISRSKWAEIMSRCTQNRFFVCSEEVRAYLEAVATFRSVLQSEQLVRFDQAEACREAN